MTHILTDTRKCTRTASTDQSLLKGQDGLTIGRIRDAVEYVQDTLRLCNLTATNPNDYELKTTVPRTVREKLMDALCKGYSASPISDNEYQFNGAKVTLSYHLVNPYLVPGIGISPKIEDITLKIEGTAPKKAAELADFISAYLHCSKVGFSWMKLPKE